MKKISALSICLVLIFILSVVFTVGCTSNETSTVTTTATTTSTATTTATATTTTTATETQVLKTFTIKFIPATSGPPPQKGLSLVSREWARLIEEATDGRIKTEIYYSGSLAGGSDIVAAVETGLADAAILRSHAEPGKIPLCTVGEMPGISLDLWAMSNAFCDLMHSDLMADEWASHNMVPYTATLINETNVISAEPVYSIDDLTKIKVASMGINAQILDLLGGTPVSINPPEMYEALYRGTVDAISAPIDAIHGFGFYEVADYFYSVPLGTRMHPIVFNKDTWDSFGPDLQQILIDLIPELNQSSYEAIMETGNDGIVAMQEAGIEFVTPSAADIAQLEDAYEVIYDEWVTEKTAEGLPAQAVLDKFRELAAKYEAISPY